ncbi:hypothetical protein [Endozoicomonas sp. 4G]|uniref:hypothetical protein n=1 Tax=Endozoicomonas sp. 4G TaxID=2872754 RepID=UPI002078D50E|nr:hypothetical protein [Endozoicomonas sp. 4G]
MSELSIKQLDNDRQAIGNRIPVVPRELLIPFILLTSCFALWGLANNMTDVLIA